MSRHTKKHKHQKYLKNMIRSNPSPWMHMTELSLVKTIVGSGKKWSQKKATPPSTILFQISSEVERLFLFLTAMKHVTARRVTRCHHMSTCDTCHHVIPQMTKTYKEHQKTYKNTRKQDKQVLPVQTVVTSCEEQALFGSTCRSHPTWNDWN